MAYEIRISDWSSDVCSSDLSCTGWNSSVGEDRMPNGMRCLDPSIADRITSLSTMRNNEEIFEKFGFSYNTLRKVSNGMPLRRSLQARIEERAKKVFEADGFLNISACTHPMECSVLSVRGVFLQGGRPAK